MKYLLLALCLFFIPNIAHAHIDGAEYGFMSGLMHPVLGFDHLLAMVAVGIVSAQMGGRAIWSVPLAFVSMMVVGGLAGIYLADSLNIDSAMVLVEFGIISSVILLGLAIALDKHMKVIWTMVFVGFFALFHGFAHGYEFPGFGLAWLYVVGFVCGTSALHILGVLIGLGSEKLDHGRAILRHIGSAMLGIGLFMAYEAWGYYSAIEMLQ